MPKISAKQMKADIEEFKKLFTGGFYHGSPSPNIKAFDAGKSKKDFPIEGVTFVSSNPDFASSFAPNKKGATMYPVSVNLGKHFDPQSKESLDVLESYFQKQHPNLPPDGARETAETFLEDLRDPLNNWNLLERQSLLQHLRDTGHDTFAVTEGGIKNVGVFEPHNIRGKFAAYDPAEAMNPDFMKADGGLIEHYEGGGKVGALASLVKPAVNRINMHFKDVTERIPELKKSAQNIMAGTGSREAHEALVNTHKPVLPFEFVPTPATPEEAINALHTNKKELYGVPSKTLPAGHPVGLRLDIPAYTNHGVWVPTVHEQASGFGAGKTIGHESVASVLNPAFGMSDKAALSIASGKPKGTIATIKGSWNPIEEQEAVAKAQEYLNHPEWRQVGMDPERHSYFYDRATMEPIIGAEEALQIGPLVLAKKPTYGKKEDFKFKSGGKIKKKKK